MTLSFFPGLAGMCSAVAATLPLPDGIYPYSVVEQDLSAALKEYGHNLNINIEISPKVEGKLRGRLPSLSAKAFLDTICQSYALDWYYDGYTLHISTADERTTQFISLRTFSVTDLTQALVKLDFYDERYTVRAGPNAKTVIASGPPRYVSLIEQTVLALPHPERLRLTQHDNVPQTVIYRGGSVAVVKFGGSLAASEPKK